MVSKPHVAHHSFQRDKVYCEIRIWKRVQGKFTCICALFYIRDSIGIQEMMSKA